MLSRCEIMSIRKLANQGFQRGGFSLHNILGANEEFDVGEGGGIERGNARLFDFSGRIPEQSLVDPEVPNAPIRLRAPLKLSSTLPAAATSPSNAPSTNHRVMALERQLHDAKERMQMLNNDRTTRVRKAEEQARKAMSEERAMRAQLEHSNLMHKKQMEEVHNELRRALDEGKRLHDAMTRIDMLEADKQSLTDAQTHLTTELEQLHIHNQQLEEDLRMSKVDAEKQIDMLRDESALKQDELQVQLACRTKAHDVEMEVIKRANDELTTQLSASTEAQMKLQAEVQVLSKQAISRQTNDRTHQDLLDIIEQLREEAAKEASKREALHKTHQAELQAAQQATAKQEPANPERCQICASPERPPMATIATTAPMASTPSSAATVQCLKNKKRPWRAPLAPLAPLESAARSIPRIDRHASVRLGPMLLPLSAGPVTSKTPSTTMIDYVLADVREYIKPTLHGKGYGLS